MICVLQSVSSRHLTFFMMMIIDIMAHLLPTIWHQWTIGFCSQSIVSQYSVMCFQSTGPSIDAAQWDGGRDGPAHPLYWEENTGAGGASLYTVTNPCMNMTLWYWRVSCYDVCLGKEIGRMSLFSSSLMSNKRRRLKFYWSETVNRWAEGKCSIQCLNHMSRKHFAFNKYCIPSVDYIICWTAGLLKAGDISQNLMDTWNTGVWNDKVVIRSSWH